MKLRPQLHPLHEVSQDALEGDLQELINKYRRPENTHDLDGEVRRSPRTPRRNHFRKETKRPGSPPPIHALIAELSRGLKEERSDEEGGGHASRRAVGRNVRKRTAAKNGQSASEESVYEDSDNERPLESGAALLLELAGGRESAPARERHSGRQRQRVRRYDPEENRSSQPRVSSRVQEREDPPEKERAVPEGRRCVIKGGTGWRCPREAMIGLRHCDKHLTRMRERRQMKEEEASLASGGVTEGAAKGPPKREQHDEQDAERGDEEAKEAVVSRTASPGENEGRRVRKAKREWKEEDDAVRARGGARVKVSTKKRSWGVRRKPADGGGKGAEGARETSAQQGPKLPSPEDSKTQAEAVDQAPSEGVGNKTGGEANVLSIRPDSQAKDVSADSLRCEELLERDAHEASEIGRMEPRDGQLGPEPSCRFGVPVKTGEAKAKLGTSTEAAKTAGQPLHDKGVQHLGAARRKKAKTPQARKESASGQEKVKKAKRVRKRDEQGALPALASLPVAQKSPLESDSDQEPIARKKRRAGLSEDGQRPRAVVKSNRVLRPVILGGSTPSSGTDAASGGAHDNLQPQVYGEEEMVESNKEVNQKQQVRIGETEDAGTGQPMDKKEVRKRERDEHVSQMLTLMASLVGPQQLSESFEAFAFPPGLEEGDTSDEEPIGTRLKKVVKVKSEGHVAEEEKPSAHQKKERGRAKKRPKREPSLECLETRTSDLSESSGRPRRKKDALKETLAKFSMPERISITEAAANGQPAAPIFAGLTGRNAGLKLNPHGRGIRVSPILMPRVVAERASPYAPLSGPITAELTASGSIHIDGPAVEGSPPREAAPDSSSPPPPQTVELPPAIGIPAHIIPPVFEGGPGVPVTQPGVCFFEPGLPAPPSWDEPPPPMAAAPVSGGWDYPQLGSGVYDFGGHFLAPDNALAPPPIKPPKRLQVAQKKTVEPSGAGPQRKIRPRGGETRADVAENPSDVEVADTVMRLAAPFKKAEKAAGTQQGGGNKLPLLLSGPRGPGTEYKDLKALLEQGRGGVKVESGLVHTAPKKPVAAGKARLVQSARRGAASTAQGGGGHGRAQVAADNKGESRGLREPARITDKSALASSLPPSSPYLALNDEAFRSWAQNIKHASKNGQARERLHDSVTEVLKAAEAMLSGWNGGTKKPAEPAPRTAEKKGTFKLFGKELSSGPPQAGIARPLAPPQERPRNFGYECGEAQYPHSFRRSVPSLLGRSPSYPLFRPPPLDQVANQTLMLPMLWNAPQSRLPGQASEAPPAQIVADLKLSGDLPQGVQDPPKRSYNWWEQDQAILMGVTPV